ncbi:MAG TPA: hypothetical protein VMI15_07260 [Burkholderiales bacterium]|nr:hypothetical protein [Burkholderiales bacterium]
MVSIPLWLALAGGAQAAWAACDKLLVPALRWFVAGRAELPLLRYYANSISHLLQQL